MISLQEAVAIAAARQSMIDFDYDGYNPFDSAGESPTDPVFHPPLCFSELIPLREPEQFELVPTVHAAVELTAVAFSQGTYFLILSLTSLLCSAGVNEMQTLANNLSLKDCQRQAEINGASLQRLKCVHFSLLFSIFSV
jgi:hypothetical protein